MVSNESKNRREFLLAKEVLINAGAIASVLSILAISVGGFCIWDYLNDIGQLSLFPSVGFQMGNWVAPLFAFAAIITLYIVLPIMTPFVAVRFISQGDIILCTKHPVSSSVFFVTHVVIMVLTAVYFGIAQKIAFFESNHFLFFVLVGVSIFTIAISGSFILSSSSEGGRLFSKEWLGTVWSLAKICCTSFLSTLITGAIFFSLLYFVIFKEKFTDKTFYLFLFMVLVFPLTLHAVATKYIHDTREEVGGQWKASLSTFGIITSVLSLILAFLLFIVLPPYIKTIRLMPDILHFIRFVESPKDANWYISNPDNKAFTTFFADEMGCASLKQFQCVLVKERDDNYSMALYGYMAWNLGDKKVFCPQSVNVVETGNSKECLVIDREQVQEIPRIYLEKKGYLSPGEKSEVQEE